MIELRKQQIELQPFHIVKNIVFQKLYLSIKAMSIYVAHHFWSKTVIFVIENRGRILQGRFLFGAKQYRWAVRCHSGLVTCLRVGCHRANVWDNLYRDNLLYNPFLIFQFLTHSTFIPKFCTNTFVTIKQLVRIPFVLNF